MIELLLRVIGVGQNGGPLHGESLEARMQLTASLLLVESARQAGGTLKAETDIATRVIGSILVTYPLPSRYVEELIQYADTINSMPVDLIKKLSSQINQSFNESERKGIAEMAWNVIYSDKEIKGLEVFLLKTLSETLWLSTEVLDDARRRARQKGNSFDGHG